MKNVFFILKEFFVSTINKKDTLINTRIITQYKNGQIDGIDLILQYKPIYKKKLVEYDISIEKLELFKEDILYGELFERKKIKSQVYIK